MARTENTQLNVRSAFAKARVTEIAEETGMTSAQVVEEALRAYIPPPSAESVGSLVARGPLLVRPARGVPISLEEAEDALAAVRDERS